MSYLPEDIRSAIINRIQATSETAASFYRTAAPGLGATWPAFVLEYGENDNLWAGSDSDKKVFMFNLYVLYGFDPTNESSIELAEAAISDAIGELYRVVFEKPGCLDLASGWVRPSSVSWGYGGSETAPIRSAMMQIEVKVHQDRS